MSGVAELILHQCARLAGNQIAADGRITKMADARNGAGLFLFGAGERRIKMGHPAAVILNGNALGRLRENLLHVLLHRPVFSHIIAGQKRGGQGFVAAALGAALRLRGREGGIGRLGGVSETPVESATPPSGKGGGNAAKQSRSGSVPTTAEIGNRCQKAEQRDRDPSLRKLHPQRSKLEVNKLGNRRPAGPGDQKRHAG